ncbi:MAG: hypothetical protein AAGE98_10510 [Actinomycetota bacterium]
MAILHQATLTPSKPELITAYLPTVAEFEISPGPIDHLGSYRFDDPDGLVGIECHLVRVPDGRTIHLPLTYRNDPVPDAEHWKVGTLEHSVLGTRHVYDAVGDPVYVAELVRVIATGGTQSPLIVHLPDGATLERDNVVFVKGSGSATAGPEVAVGRASREGTMTAISLGQASVMVRHAPRSGGGTGAYLAGTWPGSDRPSVLADVIA